MAQGTYHYRTGTVAGLWTRIRVGRDYDTSAGNAAARSVGRRPSAVVSVRHDWDRSAANGDTARGYQVTVATGRAHGDVLPVTRIYVVIDTTPRRAACPSDGGAR